MTIEDAKKVAAICSMMNPCAEEGYEHMESLCDNLQDAFPEFAWEYHDEFVRASITVQEDV